VIWTQNNIPGKKTSGANPRILSLTPSFSWVCSRMEERNRFNGLPPKLETVETVPSDLHVRCTQLKLGVNEREGLFLALIWLTLILLCPFSCSAESSAISFEAANKLYEEGKFADAAGAYERLAQSGPVSAALYYNLGNAFFKSGQIGRAIAAYHQGEKITPRDPDIRANLQFARNQVQGPTLVPTRSHRWLGRLTLNEWSLLAAGAIWVWLLLLALLQWRPALRPSLRGPIIVVTLLGVILCACLAAAWSDRHSTRTVVVVAPDGVVHNGPFEESPTAFHLNDGAELRVLDEQHDWLQVTADGRRSGWLRKDKVVSLS
jgi:hypothetical protein